MAEILEFEQRIAAALGRIRAGIDALSTGPEPVADVAQVTETSADSTEIERLRAGLEEERLANSQLEERVKALKERQDQKVAQLEARLAGLRAQFGAIDEDLERLRQSNADLRDTTARLRAALEDGLAEPELVNRALKAELDALRASHAADRSEIEAVIAELKPLIEEAV